MNILEMREKRNNAWEAAKAFVETKRDKDGLLSEEDAKIYHEMEQKVQNYAAEIERMQAMEAMEMGAAACLVNTAIASSKNPANMAKAFSMAVEAGRLAYLSKFGAVSKEANASSPLTGFLG